MIRIDAIWLALGVSAGHGEQEEVQRAGAGGEPVDEVPLHQVLVAGINYLGRSATTILAGGGGEVLSSSLVLD